MTKRVTSLVLAIAMLLQIIVPQTANAQEEVKTPSDNLVTVGMINGDSYDSKLMLELNRLTAKNRKKRSAEQGTSLFGYFEDGQEPEGEDKLKYHGEVKAELSVKGLDGKDFQWKEVFGTEEVHLRFIQINDETGVETGTERVLNVSQAGTYKWTDGEGNPAELPLFDNNLKPLTYEVKLDEEVSDKVKLLTARFLATEDANSPTFEEPDADGRIKFHLTLEIGLQQVASSKFVSEWHTAVEESARPQIQGTMTGSMDTGKSKTISLNLPTKDGDEVIVRTNSRRDKNKFLPEFLFKKPTVKLDETTAGLTFDTTKKTVNDGNHTYKYDFNYDVIDGGKLTMTEVIPVTFDANGGKFASLDPTAEQKIVKEVDYDGTLTDKAENPTKQGKAFKGWATDANGTTPAADTEYANLKAAKTFYAIWSNEDIQAEELVTSESLGNFPKRGAPKFTNDFVPTFEDLKAQVKVKDANGNFVPLPADVTFTIVDDKGTEYDKDSDDLKKFIYERVKENKKDEVSRTETVKAKITYDDGTTRDVEIPIKVLKNIYKGTDDGNKYPHIPGNYVKVTIDPTDKAEDKRKTYYYVNPAAKVIVPVTDPVGAGDNKFSKWTMKADSAPADQKGADYDSSKRHQFKENSTITAQYGTGTIKIQYVDQDGNEIDKKYQIAGQDYPSEKTGGLGGEGNALDFETTGPDFKGYIYSSRDSIKGKYYKDPADPDNLDVVKYSYFKKVTAKEPTNKNVYFPVIFDANGGEFKPDTVTQKTVYVYFDGNDATVEKVTFKEVLDEFEKAYSNPTKEGFEFKKWQNAKTGGTKPADDYEIQFKGWDSNYEAKVETFYAHYEQPSAFVKYLDLDGKPIADDFKIDGVEYPTEKTGEPGKKIESDVFTADTAPKLIGYKFNRIEINPVNSKYSLDNKGTIKIYYEKLPDVIPEKDGSGKKNEKPDGYVEVKFLADDNTHTGNDVRGTLTGTTKYYVNPKVGKTNADITEPTIKAKTGFEVANPKWNPDFVAATEIKADATYTAQYTEGKDVIPVQDPTNPPEKPNGYVTVKFDLDGKGTTSDTKEFYVNPNKEVEITAPTVTGIGDYKQKAGDDAWSPKFVKRAKYDKDAKFVAQYTFDKDIVPQGPGEDKPVVPKNYVKVTFKKGNHGVISSEETTIYWVNPDKEVDLKDKAPTVVANAEYKHNGWDKELKAQFKEKTDITAKYLKKVLENQPTEDANKYVKVDFVAKDHGKIKNGETAVYWVLQDETVELKGPSVEPNTNYVFKEWKEPVQTSYKTDTTHKAVFVYTGDDVVPQKPGEDKPDVPDNFVEVVFDKGTNGEFAADATITFWVNPEKQATVTAPTVTANDDYKHVAWTYKLKADDAIDKEASTLESVTDTFTAEKTTITAKYLKKVEETDPKDTTNYVKVTFKSETNGKLADGNTEKSYWVLKDTPVSLTEPNVTANEGWKFIKYDPAVKDSYSKDTEHKAQYKEIIVTKDPKDKDYVKVTFDPAKQGTIKTGSNAEVWVLKDETVDPAEITPKLDVKAGYAFKEWTPAVKDKYDDDEKHVASYTYNGDNVVSQKPGEGKPNVPDNFVKVTFKKGDHGVISSEETTIYWVNPEVEVTLTAPKVTANDDYKHVAWTYDDKETSGDNALTTVEDKFANETTITAKYLKKVLDTEPTEDVDEYVKVIFKADDDKQKPARGTLEGTTTYWVLRNTKVNVPAPSVKPDKNHEFTGWDPLVKTIYDTETTHIAQYKEKEKDIIVVPGPSDEKDPNKPDGGRISGKDRTETAIEISRKYFGQANTVIVVDRKDFPDAMTASVLSKLLNAPILLTETNKLDPRVAYEIQRLGARDVIIVGGNSSVSEAVKKELAKFDKDTVERIYGRDRYETSAQVARRVVGITGKLGHAVVASGEIFADALTVAPYAAREGYPILLVKRNSVPPTINRAINDLSINKVTIAGGYSTVSRSLESSLPTVVERLSGPTRYETAIDIVNKKFNDANEIFLANGEQWMDALVIGPVGGILNMPILLTPANSTPKSLKDYIAKSKIEKVTAIGGRSMVSDKVLSELGK